MAHPYTTVTKVRIRCKDEEKREYPDTRILNAIEDADNIIDSYLARYYDYTGFSSSVGIINTISSMLAAAMITGTVFQDHEQAASTWESKLWNQAKNTLKLIQDDTVSLPGLTRIGV